MTDFAIARETREQLALDKLMGLAVFGERVAARIYASMGRIEPRFAPLMKKFAQMEAQHGADFKNICDELGVTPDREFADRELGYLISQADEHSEKGDFDALAILQGFIVESLAIATYESFLTIADRYPGAHALFQRVLDEERYHVDWVTRYLRLAFFEREEEFATLAKRVNEKGVDCVGGTMMNITNYLDDISLSGAQCAAAMMDGYSGLLEDVGFDKKSAMKHVVALFAPLMKKYRAGERTK